MAEGNIELVLRSYAAFNRSDWAAATDELQPNCVWVNDAATAGLMASALELRGIGEIRDWWQAWFGQWDEWRMEPGDPAEGEAGAVFIPCRFSGRGKESGVPVEVGFFQVWEFEDRLPVRITNIRTREDALAAAGLV